MNDVINIVISNPLTSWYDKVLQVKQLIDDGEDIDSYVREEVESILSLFRDCRIMGFDCENKGSQEIIEGIMHIVMESNPQGALSTEISLIYLERALTLIKEEYYGSLSEYKDQITKSIQRTEQLVYISHDSKFLSKISQEIGRKIINNELPPDFAIIKQHITERRRFLLDKNQKSKAPTQEIPDSITTLSEEEGEYLFVALTKDGHFMPIDTNKRHFKYVFGIIKLCPNDFEPLKWSKSKQALSEFIVLLLDTLSIHAEENRKASKFFLNKKGKPIGELHNPKKIEVSNDYIQLGEIVNTLKTIKTHP